MRGRRYWWRLHDEIPQIVRWQLPIVCVPSKPPSVESRGSESASLAAAPGLVPASTVSLASERLSGPSERGEQPDPALTANVVEATVVGRGTLKMALSTCCG